MEKWMPNQIIKSEPPADADEALVERAKEGDREAFGELIRRHRANVYGYARSYTRESFLAEDIVQDALIRAFLHLGTLSDSRRFLPWLHRIVRNQAYTRLAKGAQKQELVFSGFKRPADEQITTDWNDLDSILYRLGRTWSNQVAREHTPEEILVRQELSQMIVELLRCLKPRERSIVEAHFFEHLSPQEIARLFQLSTGNVYQILSRSRKKLIQEKTRIAVDQYVRSRKEAGTMKKAVLNKPQALCQQTWVSCAMALYGLMEFTQQKPSFPLVMGLSGHAFRLTVVPGEIHIAGPTMFDFSRVLQQGLRQMGYAASVVCEGKLGETYGPNSNLVEPSLNTFAARKKRELPQTLPQALELIHRSIDRGYPVLAWELFIPEFGLIYGYDDEKKTLYAADNCGHDQQIAYEDLGRGLIEELFVLALDHPLETDRRTMLRQAVESALLHYHEQEHSSTTIAVNGLAAYASWREAYQNGEIEPNGNAYTIAVARDARRYAALFWSELADTWTEPDFTAILPAFRHAAAQYTTIAETYAELSRLFPFPAGGEPNEPANGKQAIALLEQLESEEREAVKLLEEMLEVLSRE